MFAGDVLSKSLNLPVPGQICAMALVFIFLCVCPRQAQSVEIVSTPLLKHLPFFLVPIGPNLIGQLPILKIEGVSIIVAIIGSTLLTLWVTQVVFTQMLKFALPTDAP